MEPENNENQSKNTVADATPAAAATASEEPTTSTSSDTESLSQLHPTPQIVEETILEGENDSDKYATQTVRPALSTEPVTQDGATSSSVEDAASADVAAANEIALDGFEKGHDDASSHQSLEISPGGIADLTNNDSRTPAYEDPVSSPFRPSEVGIEESKNEKEDEGEEIKSDSDEETDDSSSESRASSDKNVAVRVRDKLRSLRKSALPQVNESNHENPRASISAADPVSARIASPGASGRPGSIINTAGPQGRRRQSILHRRTSISPGAAQRDYGASAAGNPAYRPANAQFNSSSFGIDTGMLDANSGAPGYYIPSEEAITEALDQATKNTSLLRSEKLQLQKEIIDLKTLFALREDELASEQTARLAAEKALQECRSSLESNVIESNSRGDALTRASDNIRKLGLQIQELKDTKDRLAAQGEIAHAAKLQLESQTESMRLQIHNATESTAKLEKMLHVARSTAEHTQNELIALQHARDSMQRRLHTLDASRASAELERDRLNSLLFSLKRQLESANKRCASADSQNELLTRERDTLSKNLIKAASSAQRQANVSKCQEQTQQNLEAEIANYKLEAAKQRKIILALEKERDKHVSDLSTVKHACDLAEGEVKIRQNYIDDFKKKITEAERKLRQQQALYEQVRTERNLYSKNLIESHDEIAEMRRKLKIMRHQIDQYKEEILAKDSTLQKEHFERQKVDKEKEVTNKELQKLRAQFESAQNLLKNQLAEENKLRQIISDADAELLNHRKEHESVIQERDILGGQLIRRNDELALMYEQNKILRSTLTKGEMQYRERLEDLRVLKLEIKRLRGEHLILQRESSTLERQRTDICRLQRELQRERTRVKVLEEELENPLNIHRWRKLAGADPAAYDLVQKVHMLQRRLIRKTEQVTEKELQLHAKEKLYKELKAMLTRVPGPEIVHHCEILKTQVKNKTRELRALAAELTMHQTLSVDYKAEIVRLNTTIHGFKQALKAITSNHKNAKLRGRALRLLAASAVESVVPQQPSKTEIPPKQVPTESSESSGPSWPLRPEENPNFALRNSPPVKNSQTVESCKFDGIPLAAESNRSAAANKNAETHEFMI